LVTNDIDLNKYNNWILKSRFTVKIGLENNIDSSYQDIIWFPQGVFIITSFNVSLGVNQCTINISGQDKMCLLNGEVGGILTAETDFSKWNEHSADGDIIEHELTIEQIIKSILFEFANDIEYNINLPTDKAYNLLEYKGDSPLYLFLKKEKKTEGEEEKKEYKVVNATIYGD
jgi:hypothetical protein